MDEFYYFRHLTHPYEIYTNKKGHEKELDPDTRSSYLRWSTREQGVYTLTCKALRNIDFIHIFVYFLRVSQEPIFVSV